jgi:hypothetical protein
VTWIDPIDMRVRQILASAFARAHRPKLTVDPDPCPSCNGDGCAVCHHTGLLSETHRG